MVIPFLWHTWILNHCSLWHFLYLRAFIASMILIWGMPHCIFVHPNIVIWVFPKIVVSQNGWFIMETLSKWMTWGYHYFWKHPYISMFHMFPYLLAFPTAAHINPNIQDTIKINVDKSVVHAGAFGTVGNGAGVCITGATVATGGFTPTSSGAISANGGGAGGEAPSMVPRMSPPLVLLCPMTSTGRTWTKNSGKNPNFFLGRNQKRWPIDAPWDWNIYLHLP